MSDVSGESAMSRHEFTIAYTGSGREDDHSIDVQALAPALLAFGRLLREANATINGKKSTAKVLVVSDFEHKCFSINFELIVSFYERIKALLSTDTAHSAKDILEWVGIIGTPTVGGTVSFIKFLQWRRGRKISQVTPLTDADKTGIVEVRIEGDGNSLHVHNNVYRLAENPRALRAARDAFLPLGRDGFDGVQLQDSDGIVQELHDEEIKDIVSSRNVGIEEAKETEPEIETTPAWLSVYSPVFDPSAPSWRFQLGRDIIYADISETNIAQAAIARGGVMVDEAYLVTLEITTETDAQGNKKSPTYRVIDVTKFVPAGPSLRQGSLFEDRPS
jgi:hypothetical protein